LLSFRISDNANMGDVFLPAAEPATTPCAEGSWRK